MDKNYCIYIHINTINKKVYIGQTKQKLQERWRNGEGYKREPKFYNAIKKYGWDSFEHLILETNLSKEEANQREAFYIKQYNAFGENGYNLTEGGSSNPMIYEVNRKKVSEAVKGEKNGMYGKHLSQNAKDKIRENSKRYWKNLSEQEYQDICESRQGGKNAHAKRTLCVETGIIYDCARDAAEALGVDRKHGGSCISTAIKKNKAYFGYHWRYV